MQRQRLSGGRLKSGAYDAARQLLELEFVDGRISHFHQVPPEVWRRLRAAPNPGTFYEDRVEEEYRRTDAGRSPGATDPEATRAGLEKLFGPAAPRSDREPDKDRGPAQARRRTV